MSRDWVSEKEWILFCDESVGKGEYFSNFYGGALVKASEYERITRELRETMKRNGIAGEVKWSKTTDIRLPAYSSLIRRLFDEVRADNLKIRVMFTHDYHRPTGLTDEHRGNSYFILYYQFIKHSFGFSTVPARTGNTWLRIYFDQFPDTTEKVTAFRDHVERLQETSTFSKARLRLRRSDMTEVRSHDHPILQCLDVVLGSMAFRLNDRHKTKPEGKRVRGKRTRAKEALYRNIREEICRFKPSFNAGISTGTTERYPTRWELPYAHWKFVPREFRIDESKSKKKPRDA